MKERPILFSAPMVRAILAGNKTQTRRVAPIADLNIRPFSDDMVSWGISFTKPVKGVLGSYSGGKVSEDQARRIIASQFCPYGTLGDRLWVRETWGVVSHTWDDNGGMIDWTPDRPTTPVHEMKFGQGYYSGHVIYAADGFHEWAGDDDGGGEPRSAWHPSIHMPRKASRITLEIVNVRVERLHDISEADATAEGCVVWPECKEPAAINLFGAIWDRINGDGSWDANPWVWVVEFKPIKTA